MKEMALTTRQTISCVMKATSGPTHFVVKFKEDGAISMVPGKHIVEPVTANLKVSDECKVKWSDKKIYLATVMAMGMSITLVHTSTP